MILEKVQENREAIRDLDKKFDEKVVDVHKRINPIERDAAAHEEKTKEHTRAIKWLIWAVSTIGLTILGAVVGVILTKGTP